MKLTVDAESRVAASQQLAGQLGSAIAAGELQPGQQLPDIEQLAADAKVTAAVVATAVRKLELQGLVRTDDEGRFQVGPGQASRYEIRGVSSDKREVHRAVKTLDPGIFPGAFCKITEDYISGDPALCNLAHSDGSGTKSILAYLHYRETGDPAIFKGIAQDSVVMNLDDLLCVGAGPRILLSSTINRNSFHCPGEVVKALIEGTEEFLASLRDQGLEIYSGGGETADVGDLTGTLVVDTAAFASMPRSQVVNAANIRPGLAIVGLASHGRASYETAVNSGIGSNGLTSARHDLLCDYYAKNYPETRDPNLAPELAYCGPFRLQDSLPDSDMTVAEALLSPTRTYAPLILQLLEALRGEIAGLVHCSGGGQTKCLGFGQGVHFIKDNLFPAPAVFRAIQKASAGSWREMYQVYNLGHRMEVYCRPEAVSNIIQLADSFGIDAAEIGRTEAAPANCLTIKSEYGTFTYPG